MCGFFDTWVHRHPPKFIIMVDSKVEKNGKSFRGRVVEWSKALVLGTSHFYGVGSNPTPAIFFSSCQIFLLNFELLTWPLQCFIFVLPPPFLFSPPFLLFSSLSAFILFLSLSLSCNHKVWPSSVSWETCLLILSSRRGRERENEAAHNGESCLERYMGEEKQTTQTVQWTTGL